MKKALFINLMCIALFSTACVNTNEFNINEVNPSPDSKLNQKIESTPQIPFVDWRELSWIIVPIIMLDKDNVPKCSCDDDGLPLTNCEPQKMSLGFNLTFNEEGKVTTITLNQKIPDSEFKSQTLKEIKQSRIEPYIINGEASDIITKINMKFTIDPEKDSSCFVN